MLSMDTFLHGQVLRQKSLRDQFLDPLLILVYINNLGDGLSSTANLSADNASLFSVIHCK